MKPVVIIVIAVVCSVIAVLGIVFIPNSNLDVMKTVCDIQVEQHAITSNNRLKLYQKLSDMDRTGEAYGFLGQETDEFIKLKKEYEKMGMNIIEHRKFFDENCKNNP